MKKSANGVLGSFRCSRRLAPALPVPVPLFDGDSRRSEGRQSPRSLPACVWTADRRAALDKARPWAKRLS